MRKWYRTLAVETRAALVGGCVQGAFVLIGIVITALVASATVSRELRIAQTASAVELFMDGMAEVSISPDMTEGSSINLHVSGGSKVASGLARIASYGDPELVAAMAALRRSTTEDTVLNLYRVLRAQAGAAPAATEDLKEMFTIAD